MQDYHIPLLPGCRYHLLSRAVGNEKLFREETNFRFFLSRYKKYVAPIADTYCYCLMPNHFHLLVRIKDESTIRSLLEKVKIKKTSSPENFPRYIMQQFSNWMNSYAKAYNKMYHRKGALFIDYMRRVEVLDQRQFGATVLYIHKNPVHHGYCQNMEQWPWSSFTSLTSDKPTGLLRNEVMDCFGGKESFIDCHRQPYKVF